mmetsp:Transcript_1262/g.1670  ORF Transcript_1262/g.1670 Transcript_1262/m.1670 type:complete len:125 (-) Transcript_1262:219-593(-)|eukprot:CAMPEP_0198144996 /NCGR_PEP_ID=MMETSP1443-20131203/20229_1 /TAXON_ID=186043 /ORGANISM="Entomoneis sp., Strain CCMP2396" /LENGTH=124 /DNA_ID=CAMNT_0043808505 /DNA_START=44 /DNA_END=418 /DNA_ORIENTATION=+
MGNANGHIRNDTESTVKIYSFNYADAYRTVPFGTYELGPVETCKVEAAADDRGLIVATGKNQGGRHHHLANGTTLTFSYVQCHGDGNPSHDQAHRAVMGVIDMLGDMGADYSNESMLTANGTYD